MGLGSSTEIARGKGTQTNARELTEGREMQRRLRAPAPSGKKLLVIRLDDIGDYLLFRNQLGMYKKVLPLEGARRNPLGQCVVEGRVHRVRLRLCR